MIRVTQNNPRAIHVLLMGERRRIETTVKPVISSYGNRVRKEVIRSMVEDPKTGRVYRKPGGRLHQASAPGEAPARDTGDLIDSISTRSVNAGWGSVTGAKSPYAKYLEDDMNRPSFEPALDQVRKPFVQALRRIVIGRRVM